MEPMKNCPNCGGTLQDDGRCRFCGSKVYDFVAVDFDEHRRTYIRIRSGGKIITCPVIFHTANINITSTEITTDDVLGLTPFTIPCCRRSGALEFDIIGDTICEESIDGK